MDGPTDNVVPLRQAADDLTPSDELVIAALKVVGLVDLLVHTSIIPGGATAPSLDMGMAIYDAAQKLRVVALRAHVAAGIRSGRTLQELRAVIGAEM